MTREEKILSDFEAELRVVLSESMPWKAEVCILTRTPLQIEPGPENDESRYVELSIRDQSKIGLIIYRDFQKIEDTNLAGALSKLKISFLVNAVNSYLQVQSWKARKIQKVTKNKPKQ